MSSDDNIIQFETKRTLGRYQLLERIGRGGMGEVWLSEDPRLRRKVAIKTLPPHSRHDAEYSSRFEREAQATAALNHPHILPIHDYGKELLPNGKIVNYIVMPYVEGGSLASYIDDLADKHIGISQQEAIHFLAQMAEAIDYAHQQGVIHRDIKPGNMLMRSRDWLLLTDFGIARVLSDARHYTQTNIPAGTPEYMAPEQARGHAEAASDIYSLAVIAYQFITGRLPFSAETHYATIIQHMTIEPPSPRQFNPYISPELEQVLLHGLAKRPADRYASARDFVNDIRARAFPGATPPLWLQQSESYSTAYVADPRTSGPHVIPSQIETTFHKLNRRNVLIGGGAALVAIVAGAGIWEMTHSTPPNPNQHQTIGQTTPTSTPAPKPGPDDPAFTILGHNQQVTALAWSPRSNVLASASDDGRVKLWDIQQYQLHMTVTKSTATHDFPAVNMLLAWSPDGKYLAIGNSNSQGALSYNTIDIYTSDLGGTAPGYSQSIKAQDTTPLNGLIWLDATHLLAAGNNLQLSLNQPFSAWVWDITNPQLQSKPVTVSNGGLIANPSETPGIPGAAVLVASPDGSMVAIGLASNLMLGQFGLKRDLTTWNQVGPILQFPTDDTSYTVIGVTWSPDSRFVVALSNASPSRFCAWDTQNLNQAPILFQLPTSVTKLLATAWCPAASSSLLAASSQDGGVFLWNVGQNHQFPVRQLKTPANLQGSPITGLTWSHDGQWLAARYKDINDTILVWKVQ